MRTMGNLVSSSRRSMSAPRAGWISCTGTPRGTRSSASPRASRSSSVRACTANARVMFGCSARRSSSRQRTPAVASSQASMRPVGPAPTTMTSASLTGFPGNPVASFIHEASHWRRGRRSPPAEGPPAARRPARSGHAGMVGRPEAEVLIAAGLRVFLAPRHRGGRVRVTCDGTSSLGHVVESLGVPLPEVGGLTVNGRPVVAGYRLNGGDVVGVDAAYANDLDDDTLIERANAARRVLLTQDRGLLRRRKLWLGAYVRGARPDEQLYDVLDRFAPPLAPWTRCTACNGLLSPVSKADVEQVLPPGTRRTYQAFSRCAACGRIYWRGAHSKRLGPIVESAVRVAAAAGHPGGE